MRIFCSPNFVSKRLLFILFLKSLALITLILYAGIGLGPDEAQYWTWSQSLDWGYYSKPPGIAWQIWLGTKLFGNTEWGVRSLSVLLSFIQGILFYDLALKTGLSTRASFWCALLFAFTPIGILGSLFAITDVGFLLCWSGACLTLVSALRQKREPNPIKVGSWILVGALFKWPIYIFWIFYLFCFFWYFPKQKKGQLFLGILISLIGLLPSIWWNWSHDWATFRHVFATMQGGSSHRSSGNLLEFLGSQIALLSPVFFLLFIGALWCWIKNRKELSPPLFFCGFVSLSCLVFVVLIASFQKVQGNWAIFIYPTSLILIGWDVFHKHPSRIMWIKIGLVVSILMSSMAFMIPSLYQLPQLSTFTPDFRINPLKHNLGGDGLKNALEKVGYQPSKDFLFSDQYQTTSLLSFYSEGQKRAYFLNLQGFRKNQFSYWPSLQEEQKEKIGYFVWIENKTNLMKDWQIKFNYYQKELKIYFENVEFFEMVPLVYEGNTVVKAAFIFRCQNCKPISPIDPSRF